MPPLIAELIELLDNRELDGEVDRINSSAPDGGKPPLEIGGVGGSQARRFLALQQLGLTRNV